MTANNCYIITEYCPQGDLAALLANTGTAALTQAVSPTNKHCPSSLHSHADLHTYMDRE